MCFRYKRHADGKWRLQTVRYESMELRTQEDSQSGSSNEVPNTALTDDKQYQAGSHDEVSDVTPAADGKQYESMPVLTELGTKTESGSSINLKDICVISVIPTVDSDSVMETDSGDEQKIEESDVTKSKVSFDRNEMINEVDVDQVYINANTNNNAEETKVSKSKKFKKSDNVPYATREIDTTEKASKYVKLKNAGEYTEGSVEKKPKTKTARKKRSETSLKESSEISENVDPNEECVEIRIVTNSAGEFVLERQSGNDKEHVPVLMTETLQEETMYNLQMLGAVALQEHVNKP